MDNNNIDHIRVELVDDEHFQNKLSIENKNRLTKGCTNLMYACQQGLNGDIVKELRTKPKTVYLRDNSNKTALHYCSGQRDLVAAASVAIAAPDLLESADEDGFTPLHLAVIQGNIALVNLLLANKADVNVLDNEGHSVVHWATVCGEIDALRAVLAAGADVSTPDINGGSPLHYAAQMCGANYDGKPGQTSAKLALEILNIFLLHPKTAVDVTDKDGRQPILWAASAGSAQAVLALVKAGARVESSDKDGLTALHCAASRGHTECIDTLISLCGAPTDLIDSNGCTALHYAVTLGHADATALLLNLEADPNRQDRKGRTPAHCGCAKGQFETVKMLKDRNGNMWLRNAKGDLPIHEAACSGRRELVQWLLDQKQKQVNTTSNDGRTLIHIAAGNDNTDMCKMLLDFGADINSIHRVEGNMVQTPLDCALQKGYRSTAKFLQLNGGLPASKLRLSGRKPNALNDQELVTPLNFTESKNTDTVKSPCKSKEYLVYLKKTDAEEYHCIDEVPKYSNINNECNECHHYHHNHCSALDSHYGKHHNLEYQQQHHHHHHNHHHRRKHRRRTSSCETYGKHKDDSSSDICRSKSNIEIRRQKKVNSKYDSSSSLCSECDYSSSDSDTYHRRNDRQHQHNDNHHHHQHHHQKQHQQKQRRKDRASTSKKSKSQERYYSSDNDSDNKETKKRKRKEKKKCKKDTAFTEEKPNAINVTNNVSNEKSNVSANKEIEPNNEISGEKTNKPECESQAGQSRPSSTKSTSASIKRPSSARVTSAQKRQQSKGKMQKETTETPEKEQSSVNTIIEADNSNSTVETVLIVDDNIINVSDEHPKATDDFEIMEEDEVKIETIVTRADVHTVDAHLDKSEPDKGDTKSELILDENNNAKKDIEEVLTDSTYIVEKPSDGKDESNKSSVILQNNENIEINQTTAKIENTPNENEGDIIDEQKSEGISNIDIKTETTIPDLSIQESTPITSPALTPNQASPTTTTMTALLENSVIQENIDTEPSPVTETIPLVLPSNESENNNKQIIDEVLPDEKEDNSTQSNKEKSESQSFSILPDNLEITDECHQIEDKPIRKSSFTVLKSDESLEQLDDLLVDPSSIELEQNKSFTVLSTIENDNDAEQYYSTDDPDVIMQDINDGRITHSAIDQAGRRKRLKKRVKSVKQKSAEGSLNRQNHDKITMIQQSKDQDSGFEPSPRALRTQIPSPRQAHTAYSPRKSSFTMLDGRSCSSRIEGRKPGDKDSVNMTTVTQSIQKNIKRYYMERKIFQHLLELKSLQIRSSKIHESILVKRAVDDYHKSTVALGLETGGSLKRYPYKDYTFKNFEIFLYETLKSLQKNGTHNFQNISDVYKEAERRLSPDYSRCEKALNCTTKTHRCLHAAHAYTGIPCAAYIPMMNHHTMPKYGFGPLKNTGVGSFYLPKILTKNAKFGNKVSLELTHGNSKQLISLPSEKLDSNKRYYVTFTVKGNNDDMTNNVNEQNVEDEQSLLQQQQQQQQGRSRSNSKNENDIIKENI